MDGVACAGKLFCVMGGLGSTSEVFGRLQKARLGCLLVRVARLGWYSGGVTVEKDDGVRGVDERGLQGRHERRHDGCRLPAPSLCDRLHAQMDVEGDDPEDLVDLVADGFPD